MLVEARQTQARRASQLHARHVVRLRRRFETVQLKDSVLDRRVHNAYRIELSSKVWMQKERAALTQDGQSDT
ncbi:MAG: hypothetical protein ABI640_17970 [Gammaproteobacteria bacterium]